jgi:hypothetical protein
MVDTPRTVAALIAASADNTSGNYSNQNLRDLIVSILTPIRTLQTSNYTLALTDQATCLEMDYHLIVVFLSPLMHGLIFTEKGQLL